MTYTLSELRDMIKPGNKIYYRGENFSHPEPNNHNYGEVVSVRCNAREINVHYKRYHDNSDGNGVILDSSEQTVRDGFTIVNMESLVTYVILDFEEGCSSCQSTCKREDNEMCAFYRRI